MAPKRRFQRCDHADVLREEAAAATFQQVFPEAAQRGGVGGGPDDDRHVLQQIPKRIAPLLGRFGKTPSSIEGENTIIGLLPETWWSCTKQRKPLRGYPLLWRLGCVEHRADRSNRLDVRAIWTSQHWSTAGALTLGTIIMERSPCFPN